ncbi:hypothetical protein [Acutalibacter muris]|uniref:hypothetical protein n=1 Tax=Acutalibacter muris TaxID=1796620 RepID=UPI001C3F07FA|nr:hypothetical protein [Acutalibacter muris]
MQMKIERRQPSNIFRKKRKWRLRDHLPIRTVAKYAALTIAGVLLFRAGQAHALVQRGYEALGGEVFALFLPGFYWMVSRVVRDMLEMKKGGA